MRKANGPAAAAGALFGLAAAVVRWVTRDIGLTSMSTLSTLQRSGPRRITDLAIVEGVTQPSMTALVNGLERAGLVERQGDPTDKRVALVVLSAKGREFIQERRRRGTEGFEQSIKKLSADEAASLIAAIPALERLVELSQVDDYRQDPANRPTDGVSQP
jgi:DNA-binding MarR family transcriptional regulator